MVKGRLPGAVIGQVFRPGTATPRDFPRYAGIVAKGLDLKLFRDAEIVRAAVEGELLPFSGTTYIAPLQHNAIPDKKRSRLYTSDGRTVSATRWDFLESVSGSKDFDQVKIDASIFDASESYLLDYISKDNDLQDLVPVDELREVKAVGDNAGQLQYTEGTDFRFVTSFVGPDATVGNTYPDPGVTAIVADPNNTGTPGVDGDFAFASTAYTHNYNRTYVATVTAAAGVAPNRTATLVIEAYNTSSGYEDAAPRLLSMGNAITVNLDEAVTASLSGVAVEYGVTLDFAFNTNNFVLGDIFTFDGVGPGLMELSDAMQNDNQYAELSAVVASATGQGDLTINPQSVYNATVNRPYELECTAIAGVGDTRTASFRWRTTPDLLMLEGNITATGASTLVSGIGSQFASQVEAGDMLFIGNDKRPVEVDSVTNANELVLVDPYPFTTKTNVKVLRFRERTGLLTAVPVLSPNRVLLDSGIYVDLDFGPNPADNFAVTDKFSFEAKTARNPYNGKENRNYDFTVTDPSTLSHNVTMTYVGSTPKSGFGTHIFSEGNPLVLSNNLVVHARNLSLSVRHDNSVPDTHDLSLTFDGLIDWTLQEEATETIPTTDVLRDLTGSVTGTVGAYYILLRRTPDSIVYVRGPSSSYTNFTYNQVAGTNIVWFATNPAQNLTIKYLWKGEEPQPGASYYMTGFSKRPDTDYNSGQLFFTKDAAKDFLAPMTPANDAAIANEIAWDQDELSLPGVVLFLVKDSDGDGVYTTSDYNAAIDTSENFRGTMDIVVVNQFSAREEFRDSVVNMNDPTVARRRIGYFGFPTNYPIGDEFTSGSRVYVARQELQVFEESVARGSLAIIGNSYAKKTILVDSLGNQDTVGTVPTQVTLDGSFLAVALAARVASFNEPWETIYNLSVSGFDEIEPLTEKEMIQLLDAGIIPIRVEGGSGFYIGTTTTDETEPSTQQLSGTVQRQYVLNRLQDVIERRVIGFVADSPEEAAQRLSAEIVAELGSMVSERKIAQYVDASTGTARQIDPSIDVKAFRDSRDPTRAFFRASWYQKYPILFVDGLVSVDAPIS